MCGVRVSFGGLVKHCINKSPHKNSVTVSVFTGLFYLLVRGETEQ